MKRPRGAKTWGHCARELVQDLEGSQGEMAQGLGYKSMWSRRIPQ